MTAHRPPDKPTLPPVSKRLLLALVVVAAVLAGVTGPAPPQQQSDAPSWAIAPHQEQAVLQWLGPLTDGAQLTAAWRVADVAIAPDGLRLRLRAGEAGAGLWASLRLDCQPPRLALELPPGLPPDVAQTVQVAAAALRLPGPFQLNQPVARPPPVVAWQSLALAYLTLRFFSVLTALLAAIWLAGSLPRALWLPYAALTLLAAVARAWLSPATFLHEFYHVDSSLSMLAGQPGFFNGYGGPALYSALVTWLHWNPTWLFAVNGLAATLTVPALARLAARLWRDERAGLVAGLLLALSPMHLRWGAAEDQWILGTAWTVLALAAWLDGLQTDAPLSLLVALLAASLAMQARPELMPFPVLLLALAVAHRPAWLAGWLRTRGAWLTLAVTAVALWPIVLLLLSRPQPPQATLEHLKLWADAQWRNPAWTPLPLQLLSVAALGLAALQRRWLVVVVALAAVVWTALPMVFYGALGPFLQRTQLLSAALALAVTAGALPQLLGTLPQPVWLAGVLLAMAVAVHDRAPAITALSAQQREWNFLRDNVSNLPPFKRFVAPLGKSFDHFPVMLFAPERTPQLLPVEDVVQARRWPLPGQDLVYYQSMACWFVDSVVGVAPRGMAPMCAAVRDHYVLEPIATAELDGPVGPMLLSPPQPRFAVGFYRLTAVRADAP